MTRLGLRCSLVMGLYAHTYGISERSLSLHIHHLMNEEGSCCNPNSALFPTLTTEWKNKTEKTPSKTQRSQWSKCSTCMTSTKRPGGFFLKIHLTVKKNNNNNNSVSPTHLSFSQITCVTAVLYASFNTLHIKIRQHETLSSNIMR